MLWQVLYVALVEKLTPPQTAFSERKINVGSFEQEARTSTARAPRNDCQLCLLLGGILYVAKLLQVVVSFVESHVLKDDIVIFPNFIFPKRRFRNFTLRCEITDKKPFGKLFCILLSCLSNKTRTILQAEPPVSALSSCAPQDFFHGPFVPLPQRIIVFAALKKHQGPSLPCNFSLHPDYRSLFWHH